jgi:putative DNA primase/helicase
MAPTRLQMMPSVASILKNYFSARLLAGAAPLARRDLNHIAHIRIPTLQPVGLQDFLSLEVPPRTMLLNPILPERSLSMLYSPRGTGKSWLGLSIGLTVASGGSLLRWNAPRARRVLYVDGEMQLADLQSRLASIQAGMSVEIPKDGFQILAADHTEDGINLDSVEQQQALERLLDRVDLLILDNLSTLMASGSEGAGDSWLRIQNWLLRLRRKGVAVLLVHHAGVNGRQRGTSRREDALDTIISLRRPVDYTPDEGARFEVHIEKARTLAGDGAVPFEAVVEPFANDLGHEGIRWVSQDLKPPIFRQAVRFADGMTVRQVAVALGISRSEAGRLRQKAEADGLLDGGRDDSGEHDTAAKRSSPAELETIRCPGPQTDHLWLCSIESRK